MRLVLLFLVLPVALLGQDPLVKNYLTENNLKGNIKTIEYLNCEVTPDYESIDIDRNYHEFIAISNGNIVSRSVYDGLNNLRANWEYEYDEAGRKISMAGVQFSRKGDISTCSIDYYEYDPSGYLNKQISPSCQEEYLGNYSEYHYNEIGIMILKVSINSAGESKLERNYIYDKTLNTIFQFGQDSRIKSIHKYNAFGEKVESVIYSKGQLDWRWTCKYSKKGEPIKRTSFSANAPHANNKYGGIWKWEIFYDSQKNPIEAIGANNSGDVEMIRFVYEYDDIGNWVSRMKFVNGECVENLMRILAYEK